MSEKIIVSVHYTAEDYARGFNYVQKRSFFAKFVYFIPVAVILFSLLFVFIKDPQKAAYAFSRPQGFLPIVIAVVLGIPIFYFLNRRKYSFLVKKQFDKQIKSSPALQTEKTIIFDEEGMIGHTGLGSGEVSWNAFIEATETEDYFYFFTAPKMAQFVPKRAFKSEFQQNQLRSIVRKELGDKAKF